ncbi:MAG: GNAT family N-acetyltransferase [Bacteroidia bacterium]|nr:GNAT family N-acetyltransferase [Bacteroidia bacterium]MCZ2247906.1 GNAT family N-acetyltransferase [Bacteroidia bacterium]
MFSYCFKHFNELSVNELYDIFLLRQQIFVVEQCCAYHDIDEFDKQSFHLMIYNPEQKQLIACLRYIPKGARYKNVSEIGRVVVNKTYRNKGIGSNLVGRCIEYVKAENPSCPIVIRALDYLANFYIKQGFIVRSEVYEEDGFYYIDMSL